MNLEYTEQLGEYIIEFKYLNEDRTKLIKEHCVIIENYIKIGITGGDIKYVNSESKQVFKLIWNVKRCTGIPLYKIKAKEIVNNVLEANNEYTIDFSATLEQEIADALTFDLNIKKIALSYEEPLSWISFEDDISFDSYIDIYRKIAIKILQKEVYRLTDHINFN